MKRLKRIINVVVAMLLVVMFLVTPAGNRLYGILRSAAGYETDATAAGATNAPESPAEPVKASEAQPSNEGGAGNPENVPSEEAVKPETGSTGSEEGETPSETGEIEPEDSGKTEPEDTGKTEPEDNGKTEPEDSGKTEPEDTGKTEPEDNGKTEPEESKDLPDIFQAGTLAGQAIYCGEMDEETASAMLTAATQSNIDLKLDTYRDCYYTFLSAEKKQIYEAIEKQLIYYPQNTVTFETNLKFSEFRDVIYGFLYSHPELYWLTCSVWYWSRGNVYTVEYQGYTCDETAFNAFYNPIINKVKEKKTDYEKVRTAYDWLMDHVSYDKDMSDSNVLFNQTTYSAITSDTVCAGYAKALLYILRSAGVKECCAVSSDNHAYNMVKLSGSWYLLDATWDDQSPRTYSWFLLGSRSVTEKDRTHQCHNYGTNSMHKYPTLAVNDYNRNQPQPTVTPTPQPTSTPTPTNTPKPTSTPKPTNTPTPKPTNTPTPKPTKTPTPKPTKTPT